MLPDYYPETAKNYKPTAEEPIPVHIGKKKSDTQGSIDTNVLTIIDHCLDMYGAQ
jgi:hypothetical protein